MRWCGARSRACSSPRTPKYWRRLLAVSLVAELPAADVSSPARLDEMRRALLEERWADALVLWMEETGTVVDVYDESPRVWTGADMDVEKASLEIRFAPIFGEGETSTSDANDLSE